MKNSDVRCSLSFEFLRRLGNLDTAMPTSACDQPNVFLKYSTLAATFSLLWNATACSAPLKIREPRGTPIPSAHATITRMRSGLAVSILGTPVNSLAISQAPSPHSCRSMTVGFTRLSRSEPRKQKRPLRAWRRFSKEPKRDR
ncbi:hypothetical protein VPH35_031699 [Triticum aestivum]